MKNGTESLVGATLERNVKLAVYVITIALGLVGNVLVIMVVAKKLRRGANDIFILNLAVADLTLIFILPIDIYIMFKPMPVSDFFCSFLVPFSTVPFVVSIFTLTSMAIYRCRVIVNPFLGEMRQKTAFLWVAVVWTVSFGILLPFMIVFEPAESYCEETWSVAHKKAYTVILFVLQYLLPLLIIVVAYIRIGLDLYQTQLPCVTTPRRPDRRNGADRDRTRNQENAKVIKMLAIIVILFALFTFPIQVVWILQHFGDSKEEHAAAILFRYSVALAVFHSCLNPLVYGTLRREFRRGYIKYISYCCVCCRNRLPQSARGLHRNETEITTASVRRPTSGEKHQMDSISNSVHNVGKAELESV